MKVKWDFVTNSSSTAYIVSVPKSLDFTDVHEIIKDTGPYQDSLGEECDDDELVFFEYFATNISKLQDGESIWLEDDCCFWATQEYLEAKGLIISSVSTSGDGGDIIEGVKFDQLKKQIAKIEEKNES